MPTSLLTGGAGFIGSHVADELLAMGHRVIVLDDLSGGFADNVPAGATLVQGSVTDAALVDALFRDHRFDFVYHLAAYAAEGLSHFIRTFNYTNNVLGSVTLVNAAVNAGTVQRFVFTSSIAVYGPGQVPMTEALMPTPVDPYGIAKYAVELDLKAAHEMWGLNYIIFRPHNVYGEHQNLGDPYRNVIGIFMRQAMCDQPMTIFGDGTQTRAFSYIDDVAPHIAKSVTVRAALGETINIGADTPYTVKDLAVRVAGAFRVAATAMHLDGRNEVQHAYASHEKARALFASGRHVGLDEGIRRMAAWAQFAGVRQGRRLDAAEVSLALPESWRQLIQQ